MNPVVGNITGNIDRLHEAAGIAAHANADIILFPELFLTGYPPEDLVLKPAFAQASRRAAEELAAGWTDRPGLIVGTVWPDGECVYNAVVYIDDAEIKAVRYKSALPNYGVFDEKRVFAPGPLSGPINVRGVRIGVPICEDIWSEEVCECLAECGAELLLVPNGSPFEIDKPDLRTNVAVARVMQTRLPLAYLNQIGGQDELVFDGASFVLNADAELALQAPAWARRVTTYGLGEGR